ncbi:MAG TPA: TetR/AcrR family transcriptional regulator [Nocardioides sp.]|uniref:TetR/AcrR family transcriptional regulator n=1 Tax=Nocardioides sp. TaxID=35761 RepID=UPI002C95B8B4|nr:TetR/AcrR family transcriptional regulator [Nocardioides sp.]HQR27569.1 TetR/AcrR family transcriptional regulator [Nocardioides sp.]
MSEPIRRGRPGYDAATVLQHAVALFNRQGYDATSMGDLARDLGLTKSAIYHHFPSKSALLAAALDRALDPLTAAVTRARAAPGTPAYDRLRALVRESVGVLVARQAEVRLLLRVRGNSDVERAALARRRWIDDELTALVRQGVEEGALRDDLPAAVVSRLLFGMVNSLVEWYRPDGPVDVAELAQAVTRLAFEGLDRPSAGHAS